MHVHMYILVVHIVQCTVAVHIICVCTCIM